VSETAKLCGDAHIRTYLVDVADREAVTDNADRVRSDPGPANMVFNNAGVDLAAKVTDMAWSDFDWLLGINLGGVVNGTKAFLPQLIESGSLRRPSRVVNVSSAFGLIAVPFQSAYSTSKFAVRGFTETLRQEMIIERHPVTVHCVHPGVVRTNFAKNMRTGESEDRAAVTEQFDRAARTTAVKAAKSILRGAERNRARILIGSDGYAAAALPRLLGGRYSGLLAYGARYAQDRSAKART
jgi:NAD(P)-dependent dehydrogenase (short-subunit alcohol dehydrogenase family)